MSMISRIWNWNNRFDLSQVKPEEVRADQIALERQELRLQEEIERAQARIDDITEKAVEGGRRSHARTATRKIMQIKEVIKDRERALAIVSRKLVALGRLRRLLDGSGCEEVSTVLSRLQRMPQGVVERVLAGEMAREEARERGLLDVVEMLNGPVTEQDEIEESPEAMAIMGAIVAAQEAHDATIAQRAVAAHLEADEAAYELA